MSAAGSAGPRGSVGPRRRRIAGNASSGSGSSVGSMLQFYTDDAPGLKITPTVILIMSTGFIGFVTILHFFGKLYSYRSA